MNILTDEIVEKALAAAEDAWETQEDTDSVFTERVFRSALLSALPDIVEACAKVVDNMPAQIYRDEGIGPAGRSCKPASFDDIASAIRSLASEAKNDG